MQKTGQIKMDDNTIYRLMDNSPLKKDLSPRNEKTLLWHDFCIDLGCLAPDINFSK
jgi:hypothetical protein